MFFCVYGFVEHRVFGLFEVCVVILNLFSKLLLQGVCLENLLVSAKKTIAMVAMDLDNVHNMVSHISKFATTIFANLFNHKGKEENNDNTRMEHFGPCGNVGIKKFQSKNS